MGLKKLLKKVASVALAPTGVTALSPELRNAFSGGPGEGLSKILDPRGQAGALVNPSRGRGESRTGALGNLGITALLAAAAGGALPGVARPGPGATNVAQTVGREAAQQFGQNVAQQAASGLAPRGFAATGGIQGILNRQFPQASELQGRLQGLGDVPAGRTDVAGLFQTQKAGENLRRPFIRRQQLAQLNRQQDRQRQIEEQIRQRQPRPVFPRFGGGF